MHVVLLRSRGTRLGAVASLAVAVAFAVVPSGAATATTTDSATTAPSLHDALARYLATRTGHVVVAVHDLDTDSVLTYHPGHRQRAASVVKVELLEAYLAHHHTPLSTTAAARAHRMITLSDNVAATRTWNLVGHDKGLNAFGRRIGLLATTSSSASGPGYAWGNTLTTPRDQLRVLELLRVHNDVLTDRDRRYVKHLMRTVTPSQAWGVSYGVPGAGTTVALKNGWKPLSGPADWQVNSIGIVHGRGRNYQIAVMSTGDPSMAYGVATVEAVSRIVWRHTT